MDTTDAQTLSNLFPKYASYITAGLVILGIIGRVIHAIEMGGGLLSLWNNLFKGTPTPETDIAVNNAVKAAESTGGAVTMNAAPPGALAQTLEQSKAIPTVKPN